MTRPAELCGVLAFTVIGIYILGVSYYLSGQDYSDAHVVTSVLGAAIGVLFLLAAGVLYRVINKPRSDS